MTERRGSMGRVHKVHRRTGLILAAAVLLAAASPAVPARASSLEEQKQDALEEIESLKSDIESVEEEIGKLQSSKADIQSYITQLDAEMAELEEQADIEAYWQADLAFRRLLVEAAPAVAAPEVYDDLLGAILPDRNDGTDGTDGGDTGGTTPPVLAPGDGELQVHFMDVGQGDSILILFPDGKDMLIDCANYNDSSSIRTEIFDYMDDYVTDGQLDYLMLTHCDSDHVYFMDEVLEEYQVDNIFMPDVLAAPNGTSQTAQALRDGIAALDGEKLAMFDDEDVVTSQTYAEFFIAALTEPDCTVTLNVDPDEDTNSIVITDGEKLSDRTYDGATYMLTFYCPTAEYYAESDLSSAEEKNAISPIGVLEYNGFRIVLTGDSNEINEPAFVDRIGGALDCDVLKVGHHGSETSSTEEFLDAIDCEYAVISCNANGNTFSHPRQNTLDRFIARDMTIYRTDNNGNIVLTVGADGSHTFVTEKEADQAVNRDGWTDEEIAAKG